jgi:hypothetical protein
MVYQHLPNPSGSTHDRMSAKPRPSRYQSDQDLPAPRESAARRDRPGAIAVIAGRLMRAFRTHR